MISLRLQLFKNSTIDFNAVFNPLGNNKCRSPEVILAFLFYEGRTIHNASDQFVSCVYFFFVDCAFHPSQQTKFWTVKFKKLYLQTHWKLDTCLCELIYLESSLLPPPKIFTIPPQTPKHTPGTRTRRHPRNWGRTLGNHFHVSTIYPLP